MKIRSDSLYAKLTRIKLRDEFFAWYEVEHPSYSEMMSWFKVKGHKTSFAAIYKLITKHYPRLKTDEKGTHDVNHDAPKTFPTDCKNCECLRKTIETISGKDFEYLRQIIDAQNKYITTLTNNSEDPGRVLIPKNKKRKKLKIFDRDYPKTVPCPYCNWYFALKGEVKPIMSCTRCMNEFELEF